MKTRYERVPDLRAGVVELSCLTDGQTSGAQNQDFSGSKHICGFWGTGVSEMLHETLLH